MGYELRSKLAGVASRARRRQKDCKGVAKAMKQKPVQFRCNLLPSEEDLCTFFVLLSLGPGLDCGIVLPSHGRGRRFEPCITHQIKQALSLKS